MEPKSSGPAALAMTKMGLAETSMDRNALKKP
jgi:hypothetical protein